MKLNNKYEASESYFPFWRNKTIQKFVLIDFTIPGADGKLFGPVIAKTWSVPIYKEKIKQLI